METLKFPSRSTVDFSIAGEIDAPCFFACFPFGTHLLTLIRYIILTIIIVLYKSSIILVPFKPSTCVPILSPPHKVTHVSYGVSYGRSILPIFRSPQTLFPHMCIPHV